MLTAEELRAIAARHAEVEADHTGMSNNYPLPYDRSQEHVDRGALLSFVRALIEPFPDGRPPMYDHLCQWCGCGDSKVDHADCAWLAAQGVKP